MSHLEEIAVRFQVQLEGLKNSNQNAYNKVLRELSAVLEEEVGTKEITSLTRKELEELIKRVHEAQSVFVDDAVDELIDSLKELAKYSYEFEAGSLVAGSLADKVSPKTNITILWKKVQEHPLSVDGSMLKSWTSKLSSVQVSATENLIRRAYSEGWSNRDMMRAYTGTRAMRYTDGIVATIGRSNQTVIRTAMQHVNSVSRMKVWEDNDEIVKGYRWVSTLDRRTSSRCRNLDGEEFKIGEGPLPPIHPNCRSTTVAVLAKEFEDMRSGLTRESASGPVPQKMTYYDWLKTQSREFQDEVLGEARSKLFNDSGMTIEEFTRLQLNKYFKPLTLNQMRLLKPLAFKRAGI